MSLPTINFRTFTVDNIIECLKNSGYIIGKYEFDFTKNNNAFKYLGYKDDNHRFLIGLENDQSENDSDAYMATRVYINLGSNGSLCADYGGTIDTTGTFEEIIAYIDVTCN